MVSVGEADFLESLSFYEDLLGLNTHRTIPAPVSCVVVAIARNCASTSNVFCRNIDNSGSGEGEPFQLRKLENRSFWKNEEVTNEGIKFGCLLEYRVVTCRQSFLGRYSNLGEQDGKQFIFHKRTSKLHDVDKILLDLQDDESVHEGLKEALEYYNRNDADRILLDIIHLILVDCERLVDTHKLFNRKDADRIQCDLTILRLIYFDHLNEALKCLNRKDADRILLDFIHLILVDCERLVEALKCFNQRNEGTKVLDFINLTFVHFKCVVEALKCFNPKDANTILLHLFDLTFVDYKRLEEAPKCFNSKDVDTIVREIKNYMVFHSGLLVKALYCFNQRDRILWEFANLIFVHCVQLREVLNSLNLKFQQVAPATGRHGRIHTEITEQPSFFHKIHLEKTLLDLTNNAGAHYEHLREALECYNPESKFPRSQAYSGGTRISFIGIKAGMINNERVTLETMSGEWLDMPLNCRESLVLSTGPVHLQLKRPWDVADDDVGGVAVVKYEAGEATCEGLILRYKPYIISRDEEPVEMQNAFGEVISVGGLRKVLFDTGNEVGTGISRELLLKMNLQPDPKKKKKVELIGEESGEFETVQIELVVRGHHFSVCGLVDAVAKDTNLLVGMDIIQQLYDRGYTIGN